MTLVTLSVPFVMDFKELDDQVTHDPFLANITVVISSNQDAYPQFTKVSNTLRYKGRVVLSATSPLIPHLREFHCSSTGGHSGVRHTYHRLSWNFIGGVSSKLFKILYPAVIYASITNMIPLPLLDSCSRYQFLTRSGMMCQ